MATTTGPLGLLVTLALLLLDLGRRPVHDEVGVEQPRRLIDQCG